MRTEDLPKNTNSKYKEAKALLKICLIRVLHQQCILIFLPQFYFVIFATAGCPYNQRSSPFCYDLARCFYTKN